MRLIYLLFFLSNSIYGDRIIKNINIPSCKNCKYYMPSITNFEFTSTFNKCEKFGEKNIITDKISYKYADYCRTDETKCGMDGKYFIEEENIVYKILLHRIGSFSPYFLFSFFLYVPYILK
jgi:hypothetical protein